MTPDIAQGACMALEDAVVLPKCLRDNTDPVAALRAYEARRIGRTGSLQRRARVVGAVGQVERPWAWAVRDQLFIKIVGRFQS